MRRRKSKSALSTVVGTLFFIAVVFVAIGAFVVMFNAFSGYGTSLKALSQQQHQDQATSISLSGFSFNSSATTISTSQTSTAISSERKVIFSQGLWWDFFSTGTTGSGSNGIAYETSPDGISWSALTTVTTSGGSQYGTTFSIWQVQNTVYYVLASPDSSTSFLWRYGTLNSGGTISWTVPETSITTSGTTDYYCSISLDTSGNAWVAVDSVEGSLDNHIEVWEHANGAGAGTWTQATDISSLPSDATPILVPFSSGSIALIYGTGGTTGAVFVATSANGWSSTVSPPSDYAMFDSSAVAIGNTVYFAGLGSGSAGSTSGTVNLWSFTLGQAATSSENVVQASSGTWSVSTTEISTTLVLYYGSGSSVYEVSSQNLGSSFSAQYTVSSGESSLGALDSGYSSPGAGWVSGTSSPFNIRFASLGVLSAGNNSPFAIHLISVYIYNPSTTSLVHFDTNASAPGVWGVFDYWVGSARSISVPLAFSWATGQTYLVTLTTDQGIITSLTVTSPP